MKIIVLNVYKEIEKVGNLRQSGRGYDMRDGGKLTREHVEWGQVKQYF